MDTAYIKDGARLHVNLAAFDMATEGFILMSAFGFTTAVKHMSRELNKKNDLRICGRSFTLLPKGYKVYASRVEDSEYSHIMAYKKDSVDKDAAGVEHIHAYIFLRPEEEITDSLYDMQQNNTYPEELVDAVFEKLDDLSPAPILKGWTRYIMDGLVNTGHLRQATARTQDYNDGNFYCYFINCTVDEVINRISNGLRSRAISIGEKYEPSSEMNAISGIDAYLNTFSETLTNKIQTSFRPRFMPQVDSYSQTLKDISDYFEWHGHLGLYHAQKDVIQSVALAWEHQKNAFIIGEPGSGKTAMSIGAILTANKDKHWMTNFIQCPGHLVEKWKREIERLAPLSEAHIVENFDQLIALKPRIMDKKRARHLWVIISKETAKFGYEERPAAVWSEHRKCYVCPHCGKPLYWKSYVGKGKQRRTILNFLGKDDFLSKNAKNTVCINKVKVWNKDKGEYEEQDCATKLWEPAVREQLNEEASCYKWTKTSAGWIETRFLPDILDDLVSRPELDKDQEKILDAVSAAIDVPPIPHMPRKFPIAKYVRMYMKGCIDYFISDEVHELKSKDSLQGQAFGDFVYAANKTLALTGTLLNGYAHSIYYILFRMFAKQMKEEGYEFNDENAFSMDYGVTRESRWYEMRGANEFGERQGSTKVKKLPGVSPIVFTKFLLENAAFISLEDIADALPGYQEIPIGVDMDGYIEIPYKELEQRAKELITSKQKGAGSKVMGQVIQLLSVYPDQPFNQPNVINPVSGDIEIVPKNCLRYADSATDILSPKEEALLSLVEHKKQAGEKVLVYINWTHRTSLSERLPRILAAHGIKSAVLKSDMAAAKREAWIEKQVKKEDIDVLICNPELVKTGLDLLDFTTICFYQMGYNLFTLRQASRRSWRISQTKDIEVYFLYYKKTVQEQAMSLMASKLQASMAIEGKFSEEGLRAMADNQDILTAVAESVAEGIKSTVDTQVFQKSAIKSKEQQEQEETTAWKPFEYSSYSMLAEPKKKSRKRKDNITFVLGQAEEDLLNHPGEGTGFLVAV